MDGWKASASAWIDSQGEAGDYSRAIVLDAPMLERVKRRSHANALDVGCGEGRFCRLLTREGIATVGLDPTEPLIDHARLRDPNGMYCVGRAEALPFRDASFDLVVSYLSLLDIADAETAVCEMARLLRPNGSLLIANMTSFFSAGPAEGWTRDTNGADVFRIDRYLEERSVCVSWDGIAVLNWHRPLSQYMNLLLGRGLRLRSFDEPTPQGGAPASADRYRRVPLFLVMEWEKS